MLNYRIGLLLEQILYIFAAILVFVLACTEHLPCVEITHFFYLVLCCIAAQIISCMIRLIFPKNIISNGPFKKWFGLWLCTVLVWLLCYILGETIPRPSVLFFGDGRVPGFHWFEILVAFLTPIWLLILYARYVYILCDEFMQSQKLNAMKRYPPGH